MGILLASAAILHRTLEHDKIIVAFLSVVFLWPIVVLFAPKILLRSQDATATDEDVYDNSLSQKLHMLAQQQSMALLEEEKVHLKRVAMPGNGQITLFSDAANFNDILENYWESDIPPEAYYALTIARRNLEDRNLEEYDEAKEVRFSRRPPDWYIGFSNEFVKSIAKVDKKKQGRVLDAISKISMAPIQPIGDTIKPLTGDLAGLWRYRIGDDRLIYFPDPESKKVVLISFASRGSAYEEVSDVSNLFPDSREHT